ncbi:hypothetical protein [Halobacillus sp. BBL2006]|uniref:hypothetical protein n=1 Tax=Halobacillus sp. BBL2006 TaxID=1543706 RepID=UPI000542AE84|nr:hypothetical protein [Halobacillus sp. BBL2006]KHE72416.1 hypothetical protein LD39_04640 [Halobacillus sp. BBL2006]
MLSTISLVIFAISFLITLIGGSTHHFLLLTVSITIASVAWIFFSLSINKNSKHIKKEFRGTPLKIIRMVLLLAGIACALISSIYLRDIPSYIQKDYETLKGVPSKIENVTTSRYEGNGIDIILHGKEFRINDNLKIDHLKDKQSIIQYLPHSEWIISYKVID